MRDCIIISLGEITSQNQLRAFEALSAEISPDKCIVPLLAIILVANSQQLNDFKTGKLTENDFVDHMIAEIASQTGKTLIPDQFIKAWNSMNPTFDTFKTQLEQLAAAKQDDHEIILISNTNPIDIRHLISELDKHQYPYTLNETGTLTHINNMPIYLSYQEGVDKTQLLERIIPTLRRKADESFGGRHSFMGNISPNANTAICYVRSENKIEQPHLRAYYDQELKSIEELAIKMGVEIIKWDKSTHSLLDIINKEAVDFDLSL